jgi:hypothetical protein
MVDVSLLAESPIVQFDVRLTVTGTNPCAYSTIRAFFHQRWKTIFELNRPERAGNNTCATTDTFSSVDDIDTQ